MTPYFTTERKKEPMVTERTIDMRTISLKNDKGTTTDVLMSSNFIAEPVWVTQDDSPLNSDDTKGYRPFTGAKRLATYNSNGACVTDPSCLSPTMNVPTSTLIAIADLEPHMLLGHDFASLRGLLLSLATLSVDTHWPVGSNGSHYPLYCSHDETCKGCNSGKSLPTTKTKFVVGINYKTCQSVPVLGVYRASRHGDILCLDGKIRHVNTGKECEESLYKADIPTFLPAYDRLMASLFRLTGTPSDLAESRLIPSLVKAGGIQLRRCPRTGIEEHQDAWIGEIQHYVLKGEDQGPLRRLAEQQEAEAYAQGHKEVARGKLLANSNKVYNEWPCIEGVPLVLSRYSTYKLPAKGERVSTLKLFWTMPLGK